MTGEIIKLDIEPSTRKMPTWGLLKLFYLT